MSPVQERALGEAGRATVQNLYSIYRGITEQGREQFHSQPYDDLIEEEEGGIGAGNQGNEAAQGDKSATKN